MRDQSRDMEYPGSLPEAPLELADIQRFMDSVGPMCTVPRRSAPGIVPNSQKLLDNSTYKLQFATLLKFESHYD